MSCAVQKDSGDDPDVTDKILVYSTVSYEKSGITVDGGEGVGRVTKKGLKQQIGEAAINPVPRKMIEEQLKTAASDYSYDGGLKAVISVPMGIQIAKKTFNPRLGIEGGISILGTTGIVEPMSEQALIDTISVELDVRKAQNEEFIIKNPCSSIRPVKEPKREKQPLTEEQVEMLRDCILSCLLYTSDAADD